MRNICFLSLFIACSGMSQAQQPVPSLQFTFGNAKIRPGYKVVASGDQYTAETGFGFDMGTSPIKTAGSAKAFYFSAKVPEGNYLVTVQIGDKNTASLTTVKAESRRLMLEDIQVKAGEIVTRTFTVNIKDRKITTDREVSLKPRELTKLDWDDKLTLEFDGQSAVQSVKITPANQPVTVYLAGNSTVVNQEDEPWASWGQMIPRFFQPGVVIANHAESGLTLGSFIGSKRLEKVLSVIRPGDYLFVEFGHNDQKDKGENDGAWKSYTQRLQLFVAEARKKGAIPVIVTSTSRRSFGAGGKIENSLGDFPAAARKVAADEKVALIDLNAMSAKLYEAMGEENSKKAFVHYPANTYPGQEKALADNTHFNPYGAYELAKCILQGIRDNHLGLEKFIIKGIPAFDPSHPDPVEKFRWPESPFKEIVKPDGN